MLTAIPDRVHARQLAREQHDSQGDFHRDAELAARVPDDYHEADFGPYPNRRTRRARPPRHAATGTVTERQNRSDATPARTARAKRVRAARRATRYARRAARPVAS